MLKFLLTISLVLIQSLIIQEVDKPNVFELMNQEVTLVDLRTDIEFDRGTIGPVSYTHLTLPTIYSV